jgi:hypothetical protein
MLQTNVNIKIEAEHSPPTSEENVDLYIHSPIYYHDVVLS